VAGLTLTGGGGTVTNAPTGNSTPVPIMPPYQAINCIIAITGIFPVRN
jgi:microcystin-dependent protein